jgi:hypothetical protein
VVVREGSKWTSRPLVQEQIHGPVLPGPLQVRNTEALFRPSANGKQLIEKNGADTRI